MFSSTFWHSAWKQGGRPTRRFDETVKSRNQNARPYSLNCQRSTLAFEWQELEAQEQVVFYAVLPKVLISGSCQPSFLGFRLPTCNVRALLLRYKICRRQPWKMPVCAEEALRQHLVLWTRGCEQKPRGRGRAPESHSHCSFTQVSISWCLQGDCWQAFRFLLMRTSKHGHGDLLPFQRLRILITRALLRPPFIMGWSLRILFRCMEGQEGGFVQARWLTSFQTTRLPSNSSWLPAISLASAAYFQRMLGASCCPAFGASQHSFTDGPSLQQLNDGEYCMCRRYYYDGMMWSSLFVPWRGAKEDHIVKVSGIGGVT